MQISHKENEKEADFIKHFIKAIRVVYALFWYKIETKQKKIWMNQKVKIIYLITA